MFTAVKVLRNQETSVWLVKVRFDFYDRFTFGLQQCRTGLTVGSVPALLQSLRKPCPIRLL